MEQYQVSATEYMKIDEAPVVSHESDVVQNATATITNTVSVLSETLRFFVIATKSFVLGASNVKSSTTMIAAFWAL